MDGVYLCMIRTHSTCVCLLSHSEHRTRVREPEPECELLGCQPKVVAGGAFEYRYFASRWAYVMHVDRVISLSLTRRRVYAC